jgi:hypothetical protein
MERWGDSKESQHLLSSLSSIKNNENDTMDEFNRRFNDLINILPYTINPPKTYIIIYCIEAFTGEICYQLRDKDPKEIKVIQDIRIKVYKNMQA